MDKNHIKNLRKHLRLTQAQLASVLNVTPITVSYWEQGRSKPLERYIRQLENLSTNSLKESSETAFRPIQYLGSKQKLASSICDVIDQLVEPESRVCDLFSGSSVISRELGKKRPVSSVDIQAYSTTLSQGVLLSTKSEFEAIQSSEFQNEFESVYETLVEACKLLIQFEERALESALQKDHEDLSCIIEYGSIAAFEQNSFKSPGKELSHWIKSTIKVLNNLPFTKSDLTATWYFGGGYFSYRQAIALDAISITIDKVFRGSAAAGANGALLSTASEIVNTVGKQFAQPLRLKKADGSVPKILLQRTLKDRSIEVFETYKSWVTKWQMNILDNNFEHSVTRGDASAFINKGESCSAYYADPPYTIDHYSRFYHVLETLTLRDSPQLDQMKRGGKQVIMRGLYREGRYQSPYCLSSQAYNAFKNLISSVHSRGVPLVLSYSPFDSHEDQRSRLLSLDEIESLGREFYKSVEVIEIEPHTHRKLNSAHHNKSSNTNAERLIVLEGSK